MHNECLTGRHTTLHGTTHGFGNLVLRQTEFFQGLAGRNGDLIFHNINARDIFRHGVLHLDSRVDFHKVVTAILVDQEFDRTSVAVLGVAQNIDRVGQDLRPRCGGQPFGGRNFDHFLVPPLDTAIAVPQVHHVAGTVAQTLDFNVTRLFDVLFNKAASVAKGRGGFVGGLGKLGGQIVGRGDDADATSATPHEGLDNDGKVTLVGWIGNPLGGLVGRGKGLFGSGHDGYVGLNGGIAGGRLVAKGTQILDSGSDKGDSGFFEGTGKLFVLGQESVTGMDGFHIVLDANVDNAWNIQVLCDG